MRKTILALLGVIVALGVQAQICYKVEGNGLKDPVYLFGTHHLAPLSVYSESEPAKEGFKTAKQIVGEIDMALMSDMGTAMQMQQLALAPADSTLSKVLPADKFEAYSAKFAELMPGAQLSMFEAFRPMIPANALAVTLIAQNLEGFNPEEQLDTWFQAQGKLEGKEIVALETPVQQAEILYTGMPIRSQAKSLCELLDDTDKSLKSIKEMNEAYMAKDLGRLLKLSEEESSDPESRLFNQLLLKNRNKAWLEKLPSIMSEGPTFIAVGALHLAGPDGLIEGLRQQGYTVIPQE